MSNEPEMTTGTDPAPMPASRAPLGRASLGPDARLRQYEIIRELGRGGMGIVYLARDVRLGRRVAIKVLLTDSPALTRDFLREARATASCEHENIVIIHEADEHDGTPYMVLEHLDGSNLREAAGGRRLAPGRAVELMVPVVRHCESLGLWDCAAEVQRLAEAAREGRATRAELAGSTITITSLGALGGIVTTPVINRPEVAIIGPNKQVVRPVWQGEQFVPRTMMNLSSSFDHRVIDGYVAARFVQRIKGLLEAPATIFIEA